MDAPTALADLVIVGAGPAGCSCALWAHQFGLRCALVDRANTVCSALNDLTFRQDWVLGHPNATLSELAQCYASHLSRLPNLCFYLGSQPSHISQNSEGALVTLSDGRTVRTRTIVLATGLRPRRPKYFFTDVAIQGGVMDSVLLTQRRSTLSNQRILILGGGDNAVENAVYLHDRGNQVTLWARNTLRAGRQQIAQLELRRGVTRRIAHELPQTLYWHDKQFYLESSYFGLESFDQVAVLFGFEPNLDVLDFFHPSASFAHPWSNLFFAGDLSQRLHPCVQTALADGVTAAKQVQHWIQSK